MSTRTRLEFNGLALLPAMLLLLPALGGAQVPVDDDGEPIGDYSTVRDDTGTGNEDIPLLSATELEELVGPIALYPDDLLAIVLPASAYPLQIVQAGRFLDELANDASLQPDESWDDSVVALINYPEVVRLLNDDLDWTWRLGEAVVAQQADVIAAVETFRDRAYAAGNLKSDEHQTVSRDEGYIEIVPVDDDVIYVPYYEPERVVVYQPRPVYYYYPDPCPVYYYPYHHSYSFRSGFFWGVTTAFSVGWRSDRLHVFHHSYRGHPYFGHYYWPRWRYRQPTINVYNNVYVNRYSNRSRDYYRSGDYWRPRDRRTVRLGDERVTRTRNYARDAASTTRSGNANRSDRRYSADQIDRARRDNSRNSIKFRDRPKLESGNAVRSQSADRRTRDRRSSNRAATQRRTDSARNDIEFRDRPKLASRTSEGNRSIERRSREPRATEARRTERRVTERRSSEPRKAERRTVERRASNDRARNDVRRVERNVERRSSRGNESRRSEARQSQRRSDSGSKKSGNVKLSQGSRKERADSRDRRR